MPTVCVFVMLVSTARPHVCLVCYALHYVLCLHVCPPDNTTAAYNGSHVTTQGGDAPGSSPGLPLNHPGDQASQPAGSPDPGSLTLLQPANNNPQGNAVAYSTMLPSFTHYAQGKYFTLQGTTLARSFDF